MASDVAPVWREPIPNVFSASQGCKLNFVPLTSKVSTLAMDDDLVLNLSVEDNFSGKATGNGKKGGRWTDRFVHGSIFTSRLHIHAHLD